MTFWQNTPSCDPLTLFQKAAPRLTVTEKKTNPEIGTNTLKGSQLTKWKKKMILYIFLLFIISYRQAGVGYGLYLVEELVHGEAAGRTVYDLSETRYNPYIIRIQPNALNNKFIIPLSHYKYL